MPRDKGLACSPRPDQGQRLGNVSHLSSQANALGNVASSMRDNALRAIFPALP